LYQHSIITSTPFKFLVGHERKLLTVHAALIAHHSKPLGVLVRGPMLEANQGYAVLEDIEEGTFVRFSQYAYTGDYSTPGPETNNDGAAGATANGATNGMTNGMTNGATNGAGSDYDNAGAASATSQEYSETITATDLWGGSKAYVTAAPAFKPRRNRDAAEDYTNVFLCHARLYVFAEKYDIAPLKRLALYKLQRTLVDFTLYSERVGDVVELLKYSYVNTADMVGTPDDLRLLVIRYTGYVVEDLAQSPQFGALLEDVSQVGRDLMRQMLKRLE
ncbi:uncharacterized protein K441DRAFT_537635, partial [Cenococcum geophilum 1.58]|uniref:uncharacterized protein n=1 Tax=Cenococcum geophilum 1.58 TaxID=794803 RepID=UPI00358F4A25